MKERLQQLKDGFQEFGAAIAQWVMMILLLIAGLVIWAALNDVGRILRDGAPATWYLCASLLVLIFSRILQKKSAWFKAIGDIAGPASIGFLALTVTAAHVMKITADKGDDQGLEALRNSELYVLSLHDHVGKFGTAVEWLVPFFLIAMVFAKRTADTLKWAEKLIWLKRITALTVGGLAFASSFTMFASDQILGKSAQQETEKLKLALHLVNEKKHDDLLKAAHLHAETAAMAAMTPNEKQFVVAATLETWRMPELTPDARMQLLAETMDQVRSRSSTVEDRMNVDAGATPLTHEDRPGRTPNEIVAAIRQASSSNMEPPPSLIARANAEDRLDAQINKIPEAELPKTLAEMQHELHVFDATVLRTEQENYDAKQEEVVNEIVSSVVGHGKDLFEKVSLPGEQIKSLKQTLSKTLGDLFNVPEAAIDSLLDSAIDKIVEVGYEKLTEPVIEKANARLRLVLNQTDDHTDPSQLAHKIVKDTLHLLGSTRPNQRIKQAEDEIAGVQRNEQGDDANDTSTPQERETQLSGADALLVEAQESIKLFGEADEALSYDAPAAKGTLDKAVQIASVAEMTTQIGRLNRKSQGLHEKVQSEISKIQRSTTEEDEQEHQLHGIQEHPIEAPHLR